MLDYIERFQTLLAGVLAVAGVWASLLFHRNQQAVEHRREEQRTRRTMVTAIQVDIQLCAADATLKINHASELYRRVREEGVRPRDAGFQRLMQVRDIPSVKVWASQIGLLDQFAHDVSAFMFLHETVVSRINDLAADDRKSAEDKLLLMIRSVKLLGERGALLDEALRFEYPNETKDLGLPALEPVALAVISSLEELRSET
ncbi:MAG: hypothetical protein ACFB0Z_10025 [Candidatus Phaeomarinobacter sp.]